MTLAFRRILSAAAAAVLVAACARSDASAANKPAASPATATADGSVAPAAASIKSAEAPGTAVARDTTTDRADRGRIAGDSSAKLWVIMISDFQCPFCKQWHDSFFAPLVRDYLS